MTRIAKITCLAGLSLILISFTGCASTQSQNVETGQELASVIVTKDGMEMILIPEGKFHMGEDRWWHRADETPGRIVHLNAYYIDKYEVTNGQFRRFLEETGYQARPQYWGDSRLNHPSQPVIGITYMEAAAYAAWASKRLPTEAEWEKAARGTDRRLYPWGNDIDTEIAQWNSARLESGYQYTAPIGRFPAGASPYGVMDMAGNVWEWCSDWYSPTAYRKGTKHNPTGPKSGKERVRRGYSFEEGIEPRCSDRDSQPPELASLSTGFRCVKDIID